MIKENIIEILDEKKLCKVDKLIYEDTKNTLKEFMIGTKEEGFVSTPWVLILTFMLK